MKTSRMARAVTGASSVLMVMSSTSACGRSGEEGSDGSGSCADVIRYNGDQYFGYDAYEVRTGNKLGTGTQSSCADNNDDSVPDVHVTVFRVPNVDPEMAVATSRDNSTVYVRASFEAKDWPAELESLVRRG